MIIGLLDQLLICKARKTAAICMAAVFVFSLDDIIAHICSVYHQICDRNPVKVLGNNLICTFPHLQCLAGSNTFTLVWFMFQTGNRCQGAFGQSEDASDGIFFRSS